MNMVLACELLQMVHTDQDMRFRAQKNGHAWNDDIDRINTARLKEIVHEYGWSTISLVGPEVSHAAWLLVQHAYADPTFMKQCLAHMKAAGDDVVPAHVAFLEDRLCTMEGNPQVYGTQFHKERGNWKPFPIQDPARVDERRASIGLETLAENTARIHAMYT